MADVTQIVGSLMSELIQAQKSAMELTREIAESQKDDKVMCMVPVPGLKIDNFDLSLKFVIDDTEQETVEQPTEPDKETDQEIESAKRDAVVRAVSTKAVDAALQSDNVKALYAKTKMTAREQRTLRTRMINAMVRHTAKDKIAIDKDKAMAESLSYVDKSKLKADADKAIVSKALEDSFSQYRSNLNHHLAPKTQSVKINKPKFVVDKTLLSKVNSDQISTINMSLSLDEYEWVESDDGLTLRAIQ